MRRSCEWTKRDGMWEVFIRRKWAAFKELYEVVAVVDAQCAGSYKKLHEVDDIVESWLVSLSHYNSIGWKGKREGSDMVYRFWRSQKKRDKWRLCCRVKARRVYKLLCYFFNKQWNDGSVEKTLKIYFLLKTLVKALGNPIVIIFDGEGFILRETAEVLRSLWKFFSFLMLYCFISQHVSDLSWW